MSTTIKGWVRTARFSKKVAFLKVYTGKSEADIQVVFFGELLDQMRGQVGIGTAVEVTGEMVESKGSEQDEELKAETITIVGVCDASEYPIQKKDTSPEYLRTIPHLRARTERMQAVFRMRSYLSFAVHEFFKQDGAFYVHTPIITQSDCEGAGEVFKTESGSGDFFDGEAYLTVSGQLQGEAMALALGGIYTFGPTFRAEKSHTPRHAHEFWMIEPEWSFISFEQLLDKAEAFVKHLVEYTYIVHREEYERLHDDFESFKSMAKGIVTTQFPRITFDEAQKILVESGKDFEFPVGDRSCHLQTEHERYLAEEHFKSPVFVTHYPIDQKAFYMKDCGDGTVEAFDLLVPGVGELIGGSQREDQYDALVAQMERHGVPREGLEWFLDLRRYGSVPHGGFGLGFERLVMWLTGQKHIKDVILFPL